MGVIPFFKANWSTILILAAIVGFVGIHIIWYIHPSDVKSMEELNARLTDGQPTVIECVAQHGWPRALFGCVELGVSVVSSVRMHGNIGQTRRMLLDATVTHCPKAAEGPMPRTLLGHGLRSATRCR